MTLIGAGARLRRRLGWLAMLALLAGCATVGRAPLPAEAPAPVRQCAGLFERVEQAVSAAGVRDDEAHVLEGHPWLRSSRFLASFRDSARGEGLAQWFELMARLDARARSHELANLPGEARDRLGEDVAGRLDSCRETLVAFDLSRADRVAAVRNAAEVPDAYIGWRRFLGLYPVPGWFILQGVKDWHEEEKDRFATAPDLSSVRHYVPGEAGEPAPGQVSRWLADAADNALGIPLPEMEVSDRLFRAFAPAFVVETAGDYDRPGVPGFTDDGVTVEPEAVVYSRISHTRYQGQSLLQLNYLVWFSARPRTGAFDMLGGRLDGVFWRVTLSQDGRPLLYESMHACGCYHMAFPTARLEARPAPEGFQEPLLVPRRAPEGRGRMVLHLESRTHYLVGIERDFSPEREAARYVLRNYHELRSGAGGQGLFGDHGIVPGTDRREEIFFWPTGVRAPGAMRQWGTHATAFVGKRHFDDPDLIERYFQPRDSLSRDSGDRR